MASLEEELKIVCCKLLIKLIEADELIIEELTNLIPALDKQRSKYKAYKTTGVGIAAIGSIITIGSLALAPLTLGLSLTIPLLAASTTATVAGGLTTAVTSIRDGILTKRFVQQIQCLQNEQIDLTTNVFNAIYELIKHQVEILISQGDDSSEAVSKVIAQLTSNSETTTFFQDKSVLKSKEKVRSENNDSATEILANNNANPEVQLATEELSNLDGEDISEVQVDSAEEATEESKISEETPEDFNYQANKKITIGGLTITKNVGTAVVSIPQAQSKILAEIFRSSGASVGGTIAGTVIQSAFVAFGTIFTIVDIAMLASNWQKSHPLIIEVQKVISAIEIHIEECKKLVNGINNNNKTAPRS